MLPHGISGDPLVLIMHPKLSNIFNANGRNVGGDTASEASLSAQGEFVLQNHDEVLIKPNPEYSLQRNVTVEGDIMYPGVYALDSKGEHLSSILSRAGGMTKTSYLGGAEFYRSGKRLLVDFQRAFLDKDPVHDVVMLADDRIKIPPHPSTVLVTGEVNGSGLLSFIRGNSVSDYIDRAGGLTDSSDFAVVTYPNGEKRKVNFGFLRSDPEAGGRICNLCDESPAAATGGKGRVGSNNRQGPVCYSVRGSDDYLHSLADDKVSVTNGIPHWFTITWMSTGTDCMSHIW